MTFHVPRGTAVYSSDGQCIGSVASCFPGSGQLQPEGMTADDTQEMQPIAHALLELLDRLDLPVQLREELALNGFIKMQKLERGTIGLPEWPPKSGGPATGAPLREEEAAAGVG